MSFYQENNFYLREDLDLNEIKKELDRGTDINEPNQKDCNVLGMVLLSNNEKIRNCEVVEFLLENGANPNCIAYSDSLITIMTSGKYNSLNVDIIKLLIKYGADVNAIDRYGNTVLHKVKDPAYLKILIENGADVNAKNKEGQTPLFSTYDVEMFKALLEYVKDINCKNSEGRTVLQEHIHYCNAIPVITYILENFENAELDFDDETFDSEIERLIEKEAHSDKEHEDDKKFRQVLLKRYPDIFARLGIDIRWRLNDEKANEEKFFQYNLGNNSTVIIPEEIIDIPDGAFENNKNIREVIFHDGVRIIGKRAFYGCDNLQKVIFHDNGLVIIGEEAFCNCRKLENMSVTEFTHIRRAAFKNCRALSVLEFIKKDDKFSKYAGRIKKCFNLGELSWEEEAFRNCISLKELKDFCVSGLGKACFLNCKSLTLVKGSIYRMIDDYAFWGCDMLKYFESTYDDSYTGPWDQVDVKVNQFVFPLNEYDKFIFSAGIELPYYSYVELDRYPDNVKKALSNKPYTGFDYDDYHENTTDYGWDEDYMESTQEYWENLYDKADTDFTDESENNVYMKKDYKSVTVSDSYKELTKDTEVIIYTQDVSTIGQPQGSMTSLKYVFFEKNENILGFTKKKKESNFYFGNSEKYETWNFSSSRLECIEIPPNMEDISHGFRNCEYLNKVFFKKNGRNKNINSAFCNAAIESIKLPASIEDMDYAFTDCCQLKQVEFYSAPASLSKMEGIFYGCKKMQEFHVPDCVRILNSTFKDCSCLQNVTFSENSNVEIIGGGTFGDCISLKEITIPSSVKKIGSYAFENCASLRYVKILGNPVIEDRAFEKCVLLEKIVCGKNTEINVDNPEDVCIEYDL